jgi:hypothetical protein
MSQPDRPDTSRNSTPGGRPQGSPHGTPQGAPHGTREGTPLAAWLPVLAAMAIMVTGCLSTFLVLQLDEFRPKVGDIVAFRPGSQDTDMWQMTIPAVRVSTLGAAGAQCKLDPNVMAENGGSLVVEGRQEVPALQYRVHWAGSETTAQAASNCGDSADLMVSRTDLQRLANAAGGFGVGDKGIVR